MGKSKSTAMTVSVLNIFMQDGTDDEEDQHDDRYATPAGHNAGLVVDGDEPFVQEVPAFATNDGGPAMEMEMEGSRLSVVTSALNTDCSVCIDEVYDMEEDYGDEDMEDEQGSERFVKRVLLPKRSSS